MGKEDGHTPNPSQEGMFPTGDLLEVLIVFMLLGSDCMCNLKSSKTINLNGYFHRS